ncbi:methionine biosynthesis protein MetW [Caldilinea sp.]|jgi:methionine biosynthesis protein MetW|uniref:methionine biosynthesis protein MetW n=1 Tax=Caldilinea sp. TaxID=2293560 RepID=UPI002635A829|nr:methionine biosynthesis protein MetW [uncultured Caldilinea sp.]
MSAQVQTVSAEETKQTPLRPDLLAIADLVKPGWRVLDLGCGDGALLEYLRDHKQVKGRGIELSESGVLACVRRGLSVRQGNLQEGLADYPDQSFDAVILSQTLPFLDDPAMILNEMLRVGRIAIVSFSNWGHWRCRLELLFTGRMPVAVDLPQQWYESPRRQPFTVTDFARFCRQIGVFIDQQIYLNRGARIRTGRFKNLLSTTAVFTLQKVHPR